MPVRSLNSSVFVWPKREEVDQAVRAWAAEMIRRHPETQRIAYYGSYARGDWGPGSDVDLLAVVEHASEPFEKRALDWDLSDLPVPADLLVYTEQEWRRLLDEGGAFVRMLDREAVWVYERS